MKNYPVFRQKRLTEVDSCIDVKFIKVWLWGGRDLGMPIIKLRSGVSVMKMVKNKYIAMVRKRTENNLQRKLPSVMFGHR